MARLPELLVQLEEQVTARGGTVHWARERPLTFISGPSATSNIELQRVEGVRGLRRLEVVVVTD